MSSPGLSAYQIAVLGGFRGEEKEWLASLKGKDGRSIKGDKGEKGLKGSSGLDAYEIARADGFKGTKEAWLASLKGRPGDPGKKGDPGTPAVLPPRPQTWMGEVLRDDQERISGAVLTANTGVKWQAEFERDGDGLIDEFVLTAI